jgi:hypothetical protein
LLPSPRPRPALPHHTKSRDKDKPSKATRLKADRPEDLLALMPYLVGFRPVESLVMMVIVDRVVKVTARVDLTDDVDAVAQRFASIAVTNRAGGVVLIACSADADRADAMLLPVMAALDRLGSLRVIEALYTNGARWWSLTCSDSCCPAEGTPYRTDDNPLVAEAVFSGMVSHPDRSVIERMADGPPAADHRKLGRLADGLVGEVQRSGLQQRRRRMRRLVTGYVKAMERGDQPILTDRQLLILAILAIDPRVRDEAWVLIDRSDAWLHVELWRQVVSRATPPLAVPVLCLLGLAAWIAGQGTLQVCCLERAVSIDPGYSMTGILQDLHANAVPPSYWDRLRSGIRETMDQVYGDPGGPRGGHHDGQ